MIYNFSAGPAVLPKAVLEIAQSNLLNYNNSGMSVMEMSHRSSSYLDIHQKTITLLKELMSVPDDYDILFLQGGASLQFHMVPLNIGTKNKIGFIDTGIWSQKAISEAKKLNKEVSILASSQDSNYQSIPSISLDYNLTDLDYIHITTNNTIEGTAFNKIPQIDKVRLVADMSSNILSNHYEITDFDLIYAGAQKNIGPAGVTVVIIKKELLIEDNNLSPMLSFYQQSQSNSLYNTPPTFSIYMMSLVLEWLQDFGGIKAMTLYNEEKAALLYNYLDNSKLFFSPVNPDDRSIMNIPFLTNNEETDTAFINFATKKGLINLKGYRTIGGMRASLYNAMPKEGIISLVDTLHAFEKQL